MSGGGSPEIEETEEQKASARVAMQRWNDYQSLFRPFETQYFKKVERMNNAGQYQTVGQMADRAVSSSFNTAINNSATDMASRGLNPNSGRFQGEIAKLERQKATRRADAMNQAQISQQQRFTSGLQSIAQMGQGQAVDSIAGLGDVAQTANQYARHSARQDWQNRAGRNGIVGAGIGAGLNYYVTGDGT